MRRVEHVMGTVFSVDVPEVGDDPAGPPVEAVDEVVRWWHWVDETFSTYREDSQICRLARRELTVRDCAPEVAEVLDLCAEARGLTDGYFSPLAGGTLDPSGMVKGWSIERGSAMLAERGLLTHSVNGGGDVRCRLTGTGKPWRIGIVDPLQAGQVVTVVTGGDFAVATSGVAERGSHVIDPFTGRPADRLASVTLVGPEMTWTDAFATAALAMGDRCRQWINGLDGYEGLVIDRDGGQWQSRGWARHVSAPEGQD